MKTLKLPLRIEPGLVALLCAWFYFDPAGTLSLIHISEERAQCLPEPPQRQAAQAEHVPDARPQKQCHHRPAPHSLAHARQKRILHNFSPDSEQSVNFGRAVCLFPGRPV